MEDRHNIGGFGEGADHIPNLHLLVIDIKQQADVRIVHLADELGSFHSGGEEKPLVIHQ